MADETGQKPQEVKKEEKLKQPNVLENVVDESSQALKGSANFAIGAGAAAGATALFGLDGLVTSLSFPYGARIANKLAGKEFTSKDFRDEAIAGALFTAPMWCGINAVKAIPKSFGLEGLTTNLLGYSVPLSPLVVGGAALGLMPALLAIYHPIQYIVKNKTLNPKKIYNDLKENYTRSLKQTLPLALISSGAVAAAYAAPAFAPYLFPFFAGTSILFRVLMSKDKKDYKKLFKLSTWVPNYVNPFYLVSGAVSVGGRIYSETTPSVYNLGSNVRSAIDWFVGGAKPAPAPAPKPA